MSPYRPTPKAEQLFALDALTLQGIRELASKLAASPLFGTDPDAYCATLRTSPACNGELALLTRQRRRLRWLGTEEPTTSTDRPILEKEIQRAIAWLDVAVEGVKERCAFMCRAVNAAPHMKATVDAILDNPMLLAAPVTDEDEDEYTGAWG